jgi:thiol-disulfide isomerase/thioredoxin
MDRLSALAIVALVAPISCDSGEKQTPPPSRAETGKVGSGQAASTDAFCDFHKRDDSGPLFSAPPVGEVKLLGPQNSHWLWINVWATWCHPCVEEMPRITSWQKKLPNVDLEFISIDDTDDAIAKFDHAPHTARIADPKAQDSWFKQLGLDAGAPIPINVFVSPTGHVRCARAGSIREQDYAAIEKLLGE